MTTVDTSRPVTGGVDTHLDMNVVAALDDRRSAGCASSRPTPKGNEELLVWLKGFGSVARVGVEGTGLVRGRPGPVPAPAGSRWSRWTARTARPDAEGQDRQRGCHRSGPGRPSRPSAGGGQDQDGNVEAIRALVVAERSARSTKIKTLNQIRHLGFTAPEEIRQSLQGVSRRLIAKQAAAIAPGRHRPGHLRHQDRPAGPGPAGAGPRRRTQDIDRLLTELLTATAPKLLGALRGRHRPAAALLVAAGDNPDRLRSEAAWAQLCGVAPSRPPRARSSAGGSTPAGTAKPTPPCGTS